MFDTPMDGCLFGMSLLLVVFGAFLFIGGGIMAGHITSLASGAMCILVGAVGIWLTTTTADI